MYAYICFLAFSVISYIIMSPPPKALVKFLRTVFRGINADDVRSLADRYRCYIAPMTPSSSSNNNNSTSRGFSTASGRGLVTKFNNNNSSKVTGKVLSYWCFCPGIAMEELKVFIWMMMEGGGVTLSLSLYLYLEFASYQLIYYLSTNSLFFSNTPV
jgi:hypothetical protein